MGEKRIGPVWARLWATIWPYETRTGGTCIAEACPPPEDTWPSGWNEMQCPTVQDLAIFALSGPVARDFGPVWGLIWLWTGVTDPL